MPPMLTLSMIGTSAALALGALYVIAARVRDECALHDLAHQCQTMRLDHMRRLKQLGGGSIDVYGDEDDIEIVG